MSEDRSLYRLQINTNAAKEALMEHFKTQSRPNVSPTNIAAHRHEELKALLTDIKELLADHAAAHARYTPDHR